MSLNSTIRLGGEVGAVRDGVITSFAVTLSAPVAGLANVFAYASTASAASCAGISSTNIGNSIFKSCVLVSAAVVPLLYLMMYLPVLTSKTVPWVTLCSFNWPI